MSEKSVLKEIINGYRNVIKERYQHQNLRDNFNLPESIDENIVTQIRNYFLDYIYPDYEQRKTLNQAFDSLNTYLQRPAKLIRILISSFRLSFKHGRHLPKLLNSGLKAFQSFKATKKFEQLLVQKAIANEMKTPFDSPMIYSMIILLPRNDIDKFMANSLTLFEALHDRVLIKKIIEILEFLIQTMKKNTRYYSIQEISGLQFGLETLKQGDQLFDKLSPDNQKNLLPYIVDVEKKALENIFAYKPES